MSETTVVNSTVDHLNRVVGCYAWRNNTGAVKFKGRLVRFGEPGAADIICCYRGRFYAVEMKSATGRQTPEQRSWEFRVVLAGGVYVLARTTREALEGIGINSYTPRKF